MDIDPAYHKKNIVDLTNAELVTLGFLGENVHPHVKYIVEKIQADPKHLGTVTCGMMTHLVWKYPSRAPAPQDATSTRPPSPTTPRPSKNQLPAVGEQVTASTSGQ
ncbi:hypothetical protein EXIGLDRAFT_751620 [Exidia glandulosa HHB12029]|uniref:Uncharacterized protein n=1 Tax=Exidia glandulosa HHB12029 TaxID=1314781 RepID=A0A165F8W0_EXIGL|nr:hypothetical protein EXIGLDRAFT_751620 [Exidia glandulosa HHB12029]